MNILEEKLALINKLKKLDEIIKICSVDELQKVFVELLIENCSFEILDKIRIRLPNLNFGNDFLPIKEECINITGEHNINPLIWACYNKKFELIKYLVEHGADVNRLSIEQTNSIMFSFQKGDVKSYKYLLSQGAKLQIGNKSVGQFSPSSQILTEFLMELTLGSEDEISDKSKN